MRMLACAGEFLLDATLPGTPAPNPGIVHRNEPVAMVRHGRGHRDADLYRSSVLGAVIALHYASPGSGVFGSWSGVRTSRQRDTTKRSSREKRVSYDYVLLATGAVYIGVVAGVIDYANH